MNNGRPEHSLRQLTRVIALAIALAGLVLIAVIATTGISANSREALAEQARVDNALNQGISRALDQQKSVAWWDDAVINISQSLDLEFTDANFGVFLTETYGHDEVYILDGANNPIYAYSEGERQDKHRYQSRATELLPVVSGLRQGNNGGLEERPDAFGSNQSNYDVLKGALQAARWKGSILGIDGKPAIVTAITIVPNVDLALLQGSPYVLVSVIWVDESYVSELGQSLLLPDLAIRPAGPYRAGQIARAFRTDDGETVGDLTWTTSRPGHVLLTLILPLVVIGVLATGLLANMILRRLSKASAELAEREARASYDAKHDMLSGLPNRHYFALKTDAAVADRDGRVSVAYLDIDRFKDINDTLGHQTGDALIRAVADRLSAHLPPDTFFARFGGDEFAILKTGAGEHANWLVAIIQKTFGDSFPIQGHDLRVTASVGVAIAPKHGRTTSELMRHADIALYEAKTRGRDQIVEFTVDMAGALTQRRQVETELRQAIQQNELQLFYQPIVSCRTSETVGLEALVRWFHPSHGQIAPATFIPIAEESGLMPELGEWVLRRAMADARRWPALDVAINISPAQFHHVDLEGLLRELIAEIPANPGQITLEITEGVLLDKSNRTRKTLESIQNLGFKIALDDFGTGFSSLKYLLNFRFDKLKIDRSFVSGLASSSSARQVIQTVIDLGRGLNMLVVAEGVETEGEAIMMRHMGCDMMQGYLFSKPVPVAEVERAIQSLASGARSQSVARGELLKVQGERGIPRKLNVV